jgi:hypothetical protein
LSLRVLLNFEDATIALEDMQFKFKADLKREYDPSDDGKLFNMTTGMCLDHTTIMASYIFQHKWKNQLSQFTTLKNINDMCNGLLLYKPFEWAFDWAKICIEVMHDYPMRFHLLDPGLEDIMLADKA